MDNRIFLTPEQAIELLPEDDDIHTYISDGRVLIGLYWIRGNLIKKIREADYREVSGPHARAMNHGICIYDKSAIFISDLLFFETNMELLDRLYPDVEEDDNGLE